MFFHATSSSSFHCPESISTSQVGKLRQQAVRRVPSWILFSLDLSGSRSSPVLEHPGSSWPADTACCFNTNILHCGWKLWRCSGAAALSNRRGGGELCYGHTSLSLSLWAAHCGCSAYGKGPQEGKSELSPNSSFRIK